MSSTLTRRVREFVYGRPARKPCQPPSEDSFLRFASDRVTCVGHLAGACFYQGDPAGEFLVPDSLRSVAGASA